MMDMDKKVQAYIERNFRQGVAGIRPFDSLPAGQTVLTRDGKKLVIYFDLTHSRVQCTEIEKAE